MNKQTYYHFLSSRNAIHDLERKMIRVSTLDTLNDPFELMPYLRYSKGEQIKRFMAIREKVSKIYGLLCFSKKWREPLLWSHYADKHRGIALGFEIYYPEIIDVSYSSDPIRKQIDLTDDLIADKKSFLDLAKIKYIKWAYEEETRIIIKLGNCIKIDGHYFIKFGDSLKVKEVRLGARFDYKANKTEYILGISSGAEVIPCRLERQGYKINRDGYRAKKLQKTQSLNNTGINQTVV